MKQCYKCQKWKNFEDFHNDIKRKDGKYPNCKECHGEYTRERHKREDVKQKKKDRHNYLKINSTQYVDKNRQNGRKFYQSIVGRAKTLLNNAKKAPISKIIECTVTLEHITEGIKKEFCPLTGYKFDLGREYLDTTKRKKNPYSPSLDRIDQTKGYTDENTRIVIWQFNMGRAELSDLEFYLFCKQFIQRFENGFK